MGVIVHGRSQERVDAAVSRIEGVAAGGGGVCGAYVRDFSSLAHVAALAGEVLDNHPRLDILNNNAGVFEAKRVLTGDGFERTFQINVLSPYLLTGMLMPRIAATAAAGGTGEADVRVLNVTSISQSPGVEWDNLHAQKSFTSHGSYCHSKTCMRVFSFELHERMQRAAAKETSGEQMRFASSELAAAGAAALGQVVVLTCDPGTVNTKMLLAGWGPCGVETFQADDQFSLLTAPRFRDEDARGGYYVNLHMKQRPKPRAAHDAVVEEREKLWGILEQMTEFEYPF